MFPISELHLWNRSIGKANELKKELEGMATKFGNKNLKIFTHESIRDCVKTADIIVTTTQAKSPILFDDMLKENVHINGKVTSCDIFEIIAILTINISSYNSCWRKQRSSFRNRSQGLSEQQNLCG